MKVKFIENVPAAYIKPLNALVVSDLHIGIEQEYLKKGIIMKPFYEIFLKKIKPLIKKTKSKVLIVLGDVKHTITTASHKEEKQIKKVFESLRQSAEILIVKGNHDGNLERILPELKIFSSRGFVIDEYAFFHGNAKPIKKAYECNYLFCGHLQPSLEIRDKLGYKQRFRVWVKGKLNKQKVKKYFRLRKTGELNLIILPSFNELAGSFAINSEEIQNFFFIEKSLFDIKEAEVFGIDGSYLGKVKHFLYF